jgi:ribokinase
MHVTEVPKEGQMVTGWGFADPEDGGKATNQAIAAARLGAPVVLVTVVGNDTLGARARASLERNGVDTRWVFESPGATDVGFVLLPPTKIPAITTTQERSRELPKLVVAHGANVVRSAAVVVCQLEAPQTVARTAFRLARAAGATTVLNPAPAEDLDPDLLSLTNVLVPNEHEAATLAGVEAPPRQTASRIASHWPWIDVVVTAGADGAYVVRHGVDRPTHIPALEVSDLVDTTGAGDALTGALAFCLRQGVDLVDATRFAVRAASISVARQGTIPAFASLADLA